MIKYFLFSILFFVFSLQAIAVETNSSSVQRGSEILKIVKIEVLKNVKIQRDKTIYLKDISSFKNISDELKNDLEKMVVSKEFSQKKENVKNQIIYNSFKLSQMFRSRISKMQDKHNVRIMFKVPNNLIISLQEREDVVEKRFDERTIAKIIKKKIIEDCLGCKIEIKNINLPNISEEILSKNNWEIQFSAKRVKGNFSLPVVFKARNELDSEKIVQRNVPKKIFWISGIVNRYIQVPVARKQLSLGVRINQDDYEMKYRDVSFAVDGVPSQKELVGSKLKRGVSAGSIIWHNSLQREKAVRYGDTTQVIIGSDQWQISTSAIAKETGELGDIIGLINTRTKKKYRGKIIGNKKVKVELL